MYSIIFKLLQSQWKECIIDANELSRRPTLSNPIRDADTIPVFIPACILFALNPEKYEKQKM